MNPSLNQRRSSDEKLCTSGPNEQRSVIREWTMDAQGESVFDRLPDDVLLKIFRYLYEDELLTAGQVCLRWKSTVDTCFATTKTLELYGGLIRNGERVKALTRMKLYGPSLKSLKLDLFGRKEANDDVDWIAEIGNAFPNLISINVYGVPMRGESLRLLPVKCSQLVNITLSGSEIKDEDVGIVLKGFPALKHLELSLLESDIYGECFRELGPNVEHLILNCIEISQAGTWHILSRCKNLRILKIDCNFDCDAYDFFIFCKKSVLRRLTIEELELSKEVFWPIASLCFLEALTLNECLEVDSEVLMRISVGCPNLFYVCLFGLPLVCDRGVKCFAQCKRLTHFYCCYLKTMTDESLFELAKAGLSLNTLVINGSEVSDKGVSAVLAKCPRLKYLEVNHNRENSAGDSTVDAAIQAVERRCLSATFNQSLQGKCTAIVPTRKVVKTSDYLLRLHLDGKGLNRYKDGFSHPLLYLQVH